MELQNVTEQKPFVFMGREMSVGKKISPLKGIVYGDNGIGKTTLLASARNPIIMDMEGNCSHIEAHKFPITSFEEFDSFLDGLIRSDHEYKSLVIDSLDALQIIISEKISKKYTEKELSYGKSGAIWARTIREIIAKLDNLIAIKGMNILFSAHWKVKAANNPMTENYDRYDMRINEEMRTGFCNWVQFIFLALKDVIIEDEKSVGFGKKKAKNIERRVLYTRGEPTYYGKNIFDLPAKMPMDWAQFTTNVKNFYSI